MRNKLLTLIVAATATVVLAGCTTTPTTSQTNGNTNSAAGSADDLTGISLAYSFDIKNSKFTPTSTTVPLGEVVTWFNTDTVPHQIVGDNGEFSSPVLQPGDKFEFKPSQSGTIKFHCSLHATMKGTIIVTN